MICVTSVGSIPTERDGSTQTAAVVDYLRVNLILWMLARDERTIVGCHSLRAAMSIAEQPNAAAGRSSGVMQVRWSCIRRVNVYVYIIGCQQTF